MREAIAICQSLPGPLAIEVGIYIAYLCCGFSGCMGLFFLKAGSLTFGSGLVIVLIAAPLLARHRGNPNVQGFPRGRLCGPRSEPRRVYPAWKNRDRRLADRADRDPALAILFRWKVSNALLIAATAVVGLIAHPILQPGWVMH
ncbi:chromate transporter [Bradyrhizobium diazoefficiens]|nr:chromate transporter [Bradyrhizobium diazoefficiens]QQN63714.1 chromate transporter [Bradyrhizobium diazoefficiens]